jgi:hypothetical protein
MNIEHVRKNLEKRASKKGLLYELGHPASEQVLLQTEKRLNLIFPGQVKLFYRNYNGLIVEDPPLHMFPLEKLELEPEERVYFSLVSNIHKLCFDVSHYNDAGQWNIVNSKDNYLVTLSFASFWSNRMWAWIDKRKPIWAPEYGEVSTL